MATRRLRLITIKRSSTPDKKYDATFLTRKGTQKRLHFGQKSYNDFIIYNKKFGNKTAKVHKARYIKRHSGMGEHWSKPDTPGALSRWVLWNKPSLKASIADFKKRFHL